MVGKAMLTTVASSAAIPEPSTVTASTQRPGDEEYDGEPPLWSHRAVAEHVQAWPDRIVALDPGGPVVPILISSVLLRDPLNGSVPASS
jgi:hypothetical protein